MILILSFTIIYQEYTKQCSVLDNCTSSHELQFEQPIEFHSSAIDFNLICGSRAYLASALGTIQFIGLIVGALVYPPLADQYGRKPLACIVFLTGIAAIAISGLTRVDT